MEVIKIGRANDNDYKISDDDLMASKHHCELVIKDNGTYKLIDLNSTNGTFVNGYRVHGSIMLNKGDIVQAGNSHIDWENFIRHRRPYRKPVVYDDVVDYPPRSTQINQSPAPLIPGNINIKRTNVNSDVYKKGDDFLVTFFRNLGNQIGSILGGTLGCISSIIVIALFLFIVFGLFKACH